MRLAEPSNRGKVVLRAQMRVPQGQGNRFVAHQFLQRAVVDTFIAMRLAKVCRIVCHVTSFNLQAFIVFVNRVRGDTTRSP